MRYMYKTPDKSKRLIKEIPADVVVAGRRGLYNENLTADEIMLLRSLIWDLVHHDPNQSRKTREIIDFIHTWMFTNSKAPTVFTDILSHLQSGVIAEGVGL